MSPPCTRGRAQLLPANSWRSALMKARPTTWAPTRMICARYLACGDRPAVMAPPHRSPTDILPPAGPRSPSAVAQNRLRLPWRLRSAPDLVSRPPSPDLDPRAAHRALTHPLRPRRPVPAPPSPPRALRPRWGRITTPDLPLTIVPSAASAPREDAGSESGGRGAERRPPPGDGAPWRRR